jgi:hypothetical protein
LPDDRLANERQVAIAVVKSTAMVVFPAFDFLKQTPVGGKPYSPFA